MFPKNILPIPLPPTPPLPTKKDVVLVNEHAVPVVAPLPVTVAKVELLFRVTVPLCSAS